MGIQVVVPRLGAAAGVDPDLGQVATVARLEETAQPRRQRRATLGQFQVVSRLLAGFAVSWACAGNGRLTVDAEMTEIMAALRRELRGRHRQHSAGGVVCFLFQRVVAGTHPQLGLHPDQLVAPAAVAFAGHRTRGFAARTFALQQQARTVGRDVRGLEGGGGGRCTHRSTSRARALKHLKRPFCEGLVGVARVDFVRDPIGRVVEGGDERFAVAGLGFQV